MFRERSRRQACSRLEVVDAIIDVASVGWPDCSNLLPGAISTFDRACPMKLDGGDGALVR